MENPYLPKEAEIKAVKRQTADTLTYTLSFRDGEYQREFSFAPGQFNMVTLLGVGEAPISMSSEPHRRESFDHTVRAVGNVTKALERYAVGDVLGIRGPYGSSWPVEETKGKNVVIVSGGIGLAPLRPFITHIFANRADYGKVEILYGARTPQDMCFTDEFEAWASQPDTRLFLTVDRVPDGGEWRHNVGVVTTLFDRSEISPRSGIVVTCGPEIMMRFVVKGMLQRNFFGSQIYLSLERRMKCGEGKCGHCQLGSKFVCLDGPVFPYSVARKFTDTLL